MNIDDFIKEMNAYYEARAEWHDNYMSYESNAKMERELAPLIARIENHILKRDILEIACGTGNWTQVLSGRANSVLAMDVSQSVLKIARRKEYKFSNVEFVISDAYLMDNIKAICDVAFAADFFSHIPLSRIDCFLKGAARKLRNRGTIIILDMLPHEGLEINKHQYDKEGNFYCLRTLPDGKQFRVIKNFPDKAQLSRYFECLDGEFEYYENDELRRWLVVFKMN